jgi:hypothetical protein
LPPASRSWRIRNAYYAHEQKTGKPPSLDELFAAYENYLNDLGVQAPQKPATTRPGVKRPGIAQRKGAMQLAESAEQEPDDDDGDGAVTQGPANLTNRMASQRVSNGSRKMSREERLANATAILEGKM